MRACGSFFFVFVFITASCILRDYKGFHNEQIEKLVQFFEHYTHSGGFNSFIIVLIEGYLGLVILLQ